MTERHDDEISPEGLAFVLGFMFTAALALLIFTCEAISARSLMAGWELLGQLPGLLFASLIVSTLFFAVWTTQ